MRPLKGSNPAQYTTRGEGELDYTRLASNLRKCIGKLMCTIATADSFLVLVTLESGVFFHHLYREHVDTIDLRSP